MSDVCENYTYLITPRFSHWDLRRLRAITVDPKGRCTTRYYLEEYKAELPVADCWPAARCRSLAREVLALLEQETHLGTTQVGWLHPSSSNVDMCFIGVKEWIFVVCAKIRHPFDVISTVIHEVAHHLTGGCAHHPKCANQHCAVWAHCAKMLGAVFTVSLCKMILTLREEWF